MNLRPYQTDLITAIRLQYQLGHRKVLICHQVCI